jgi:H+-transporting ATPase
VVQSISFTVVLIVASIPIAIEIVCTATLALGFFSFLFILKI